ncbi:LAETG motif-containing sortase-dependent surface protein [Streptomyces sp. NPDC046716]|uniref:LAETG motif-containing sortase-dependent surface protein n=1 Tax=Streptomyces sp. NPDC046716 TaxID=3157093 RepID=UPI00340C6D88
MNHLAPVRSAVVATGLLAALASIPVAHATPAESSAAPASAGTTAPSPVPSTPATDAPTPAPSAPATAEPSAAPTEEPSAAPAAPGGKDDATPAPAPSKDELAHTGSSNTGTTVMGAGAVVLVAGGAGALFAVRRRSHR